MAGQHRSTQRYEPKLAADDPNGCGRSRLSRHAEGTSGRIIGWWRSAGRETARRMQRLREISAEGPRWGYRRAQAPAAGDSAVPAQRLRAAELNQVWAVDFQQDQTADGHACPGRVRRRMGTSSELPIAA